MSDVPFQCAICRCEATQLKFGIRVCLYHLTHGEADPSCPICHHPADEADDDGGPVVLTDPDKIRGFQLLVWHHAMKLEAKGLHHSSGRSVTAIVKREFGLKGNRAKVQAAFEALLIERGILRPKFAVQAPRG